VKVSFNDVPNAIEGYFYANRISLYVNYISYSIDPSSKEEAATSSKDIANRIIAYKYSYTARYINYISKLRYYSSITRILDR
jgi:hypothetical protein